MSFLDKVKDAAASAAHAAEHAAEKVGEVAKDKAGDLASAVTDHAGSAGDALKGVGSKIVDKAKDAL